MIRTTITLIPRSRAGIPLPLPCGCGSAFDRRSAAHYRARHRSIRGNLLREARVTEARLSDGEVVPVTLGSVVLRRAVRGELAAEELRILISPPIFGVLAVLDLAIAVAALYTRRGEQKKA